MSAHQDHGLRPSIPSPLTEIEDARFTRHGLRLLLKRDDLIHEALPGNKWRKLAPNLTASAGRTLVTFGGAYSNHLRAAAAAGRLLGFPTVGVVRGHELSEKPLNGSLAQCAADGMRLHFVDRSTYRQVADPLVLDQVLTDAALTGPVHIVPEGGSNALGVTGCLALGAELRGRADVIGVACGTGGTLAGLAAGLAPGQRAIGVAVLRGGFLYSEVARLQREAFGGPRGEWLVQDGFHCGGFARSTPELEAFAADFEDRHGLPVERLYVAKMLLALTTLAERGTFRPGVRIAAVITGRREP
ncbi:D-cysteine desulfhydrase [Streptomyces sp. YIM 130001]|uniref:1-aminocyclopropane-1-carboxylate deaminase/D-cysteine desulfhydrase n=1 Tax=Streptomyces sp. YIM 130001 TaxID=2259644 RepID=UPI000E64D7E2|nr:pyridoxal-phosphate dependent enzyme [Streptomyces sp. YIM 130001]RII16049.1 D-cysteine desulfhydrase [Streptomyces sp. YIM 130001]